MTRLRRMMLEELQRQYGNHPIVARTECRERELPRGDLHAILFPTVTSHTVVAEELLTCESWVQNGVNASQEFAPMLVFPTALRYALFYILAFWAGVNSGRLVMLIRQHIARYRYSSIKWWGLDVRKLVVGDIIGTSSGKWSYLIRKMTGGGPLSHVALYVGENAIIEAVLPRARVQQADTYLLSAGSVKFFVLRPRSQVVSFRRERGRAEALVSEALLWQSSLYSVMKCAGVKVPQLRNIAARDAIICSELIVQAYRRAGIELCPGLHVGIITPNSIFNSAILQDASKQCSKQLTETEFHVVSRISHRFGRRASPLGSLYSWFGSLLWAISPARRAWNTPVEEWTNFHFWSFYLTYLGEYFGHLLQSYVWVAFRFTAKLTWVVSNARLTYKTTETLRAYVEETRENLEFCRQAVKAGQEIVEPLRTNHVFENENWLRLLLELARWDNAVLLKDAASYLPYGERVLADLTRELEKRRTR